MVVSIEESVSLKTIGTRVRLSADLAEGDIAKHALPDQVRLIVGLSTLRADLVAGANEAVRVAEEAGAAVVEESGHGGAVGADTGRTASQAVGYSAEET